MTLLRADLPPQAFDSRFRFRLRKAPKFSNEWQLDDLVLSVAPRDCDGNGVLDGCEIAGDTAADRNANRALDVCDLDLDDDGDTDLREMAALLGCFSGEASFDDPACAAVDFFDNQRIDRADAGAFVSAMTGPR